MHKFSDLRNESGNEFTDISSEGKRIYEIQGFTFEYKNPVALSVSTNGHRIFCADGSCWYQFLDKPTRINWTVNDKQPHFVK